jgi:hypothetical protein
MQAYLTLLLPASLALVPYQARERTSWWLWLIVIRYHGTWLLTCFPQERLLDLFMLINLESLKDVVAIIVAFSTLMLIDDEVVQQREIQLNQHMITCQRNI